MNQPVVTRRPTVRTPAFHMQSHETAVPEASSLEADYFPIGIIGAVGQQHNPCVFISGEELKVLVRVLTPGGPFSENYVARVDTDWELVESRPLQAKAAAVVRGAMRTPLKLQMPRVEDLRVFSWQDKLWAIACTHDGCIPPNWIRQAVLELGPDGATIEQVHVLNSDRQEKNWMPVVNGRDLSFVYSVDPLVVLDVKAGAFPSANGVPQAMGHIRGGSGLIPFAGGWISLVHQVYRPPQTPAGHNPLLGGWAPPAKDPVAGDAKVVYLHQFAKFDKDLVSVALSKPFFFQRPGIEFAAGLVEWQGKLVASFGVADKEAWLAVIDPQVARGIF